MIPRFQHLLIPLDFTEKNRAALDIAFEIAVQNRARTTLLHVIETIDGAADAELQSFYAKLQQRSQTELESAAQRFSQAGLTVDTKIRFGRRLHEIVQDAVDRQIDLIVMSSHVVDPQRPVQSLGTLSYQISMLCPCPILLVK